MKRFNLLLLFTFVLLLVSTSIPIEAIRVKNLSIKSMKTKEIFRSLSELRTSENFRSSLREVPTGPDPLHHRTPPKL
uniref:Putative CLAVATA3/ESR (CLE)-related protein 8-like n=1 Tax=Solanum chacoense TaxID=4108 RepID=A0A0V0GFQ3_SOLCH